jgi:hypothetical protein
MLGAMALVPEIPRDGTVVRERSAAEIYVVSDGTKHWMCTHRRRHTDLAPGTYRPRILIGYNHEPTDSTRWLRGALCLIDP